MKAKLWKEQAEPCSSGDWGPWLGRCCRQVWSFAGARGQSSVSGAVLVLLLSLEDVPTPSTPGPWSRWSRLGHTTWLQCPGSWTEQQPAGHVWGQMWPCATLSIRVSSSTAGAPPMFTLSPAPLRFPCGALERETLKLQEEWWDFRHTDPRMEQGFLRGPFLEPPKVTACRCHLYLAQPQ